MQMSSPEALCCLWLRQGQAASPCPATQPQGCLPSHPATHQKLQTCQTQSLPGAACSQPPVLGPAPCQGRQGQQGCALAWRPRSGWRGASADARACAASLPELWLSGTGRRPPAGTRRGFPPAGPAMTFRPCSGHTSAGSLQRQCGVTRTKQTRLATGKAVHVSPLHYPFRPCLAHVYIANVE